MVGYVTGEEIWSSPRLVNRYRDLELENKEHTESVEIDFLSGPGFCVTGPDKTIDTN